MGQLSREHQEWEYRQGGALSVGWKSARVSKLFMKDSCYERDNDGDLDDDEVFPSWCWSRNSKSVEGGESGCLDAFRGGTEAGLLCNCFFGTRPLGGLKTDTCMCIQLLRHLL